GGGGEGRMIRLFPAKGSTTRKTLGVMFSPGIGRGIGNIASTLRLFVQVIGMILADAGLVPRNHPLITGEDKDRGAFIRLVKLAWSNVKFDKAHVRPAAVFLAVVLGLALFVITLAAVLVKMAMGLNSAFAAPGSLFVPPDPGADASLGFIRTVFGTDGARIASGGGVLQQGLRQMLSMYSTAILILASIILLYYLVAMTIETAHHGVPFGKRHNMVWSPIRLVFALLLLIPIGGGLNTGQYMILNVARWGAGLGSNVWAVFTQNARNMAYEAAQAPIPDVQPQLVNAFEALKCVKQKKNELAAKRSSLKGANVPNSANYGKSLETTFGTDEREGATFMYFGTTEDPTACGTIELDKASPGDSPFLQNFKAAKRSIFMDKVTKLKPGAYAAADLTSRRKDSTPLRVSEATVEQAAVEELKKLEGLNNEFRQEMTQAHAQARAQLKAELEAAQNAPDRGWTRAMTYFVAGAGKASALAKATMDKPKVRAPATLDETGRDVLSGLAKLALLPYDFGYKIGEMIESGQFECAADIKCWLEHFKKAAEGFLDKLFEAMFKQAGMGNGNSWLFFTYSSANPMASMVTLGHSLQTMNLYGMGIALTMVILTGGTAGGSPATGFATLAMSTGFAAGFALSYVLPLIPVMRFFFGVISWLVMLLEGLVAIPLIALAHMNTEGEGLPGPMARQAYMYALNLFLRPIMLIIGMVAAMMMFSIAIGILNPVFTAAVGGFSTGSAMAKFMFTIVYAVAGYTVANACFHLIDLFPEHSLRWIGGPSWRDTNELQNFTHTAMAGAAATTTAAQGLIQAGGSRRPAPGPDRQTPLLDEIARNTRPGGGGGGGGGTGGAPP
ncbi:MAG: DotA/TraY family protein, partial [Pseudomonadota bacterium]|nr:DotA/TraY family protein [Pseudomonadota bacterium]